MHFLFWVAAFLAASVVWFVIVARAAHVLSREPRPVRHSDEAALRDLLSEAAADRARGLL
jgi:hypothetical protein